MSDTSSELVSLPECESPCAKCSQNATEKEVVELHLRAPTKSKERRSGCLLKTSSQTLSDDRSEYYMRLLKETQQCVSNRDVLITMLQGQLRKMEELYKKTLDEQQDVRLQYSTVAQQLSSLKLICRNREQENEKLAKKSATGVDKYKEERDNYQVEAEKWKSEYEALLKKLETADDKSKLLVQSTPQPDPPPNSTETLDILIHHCSNIENALNQQNRKLNDFFDKIDSNSHSPTCSCYSQQQIMVELEELKSINDRISCSLASVVDEKYRSNDTTTGELTSGDSSSVRSFDVRRYVCVRADREPEKVMLELEETSSVLYRVDKCNAKSCQVQEMRKSVSEKERFQSSDDFRLDRINSDYAGVKRDRFCDYEASICRTKRVAEDPSKAQNFEDWKQCKNKNETLLLETGHKCLDQEMPKVNFQDLTQTKEISEDTVKSQKGSIEDLNNKIRQMIEERARLIEKNKRLFCEYECKFKALNAEYIEAKEEISRLKQNKEVLNQKLARAMSADKENSWTDVYENANQEKEDLRSEVGVLKSLMGEKDKNINCLQIKIRQLEENLGNAYQERIKLIDENKKLRHDCEHRLDRMSTDYRHAQKEIQHLEQILKRAKHCMSRSDKDRKTQRTIVLQKDKTIGELRCKLRQMANQVDKAKQELSESTDRNRLPCKCDFGFHDLNFEHEEAQKEILRFKESTEVLNQKLIFHLNELANFTDDDTWKSAHEQSIEEVKSQVAVVIQKAEDIDELQGKLKRLTEELVQANKEITDCVNQNKRILGEYESKMDELNASYKDAQNEIQLLRDSKEAANQTLMTGLYDLADMTEGDKKWKDAYEQALCEKENLEKQLDNELKNAQEEILRVQESKDALHQNLKEALRDENERALRRNEEIIELENKLSEKAKELEQADKEREDLANSNKNLVCECECRLEKLNRENTDTQKEMVRLQDSKETLNQRLILALDKKNSEENLNRAYKETLQENENMQKLMFQKDVALNQLKQELEFANEEKTKAVKQNKDLTDDYKTKLDTMTNEYCGAQNEILRLKASKEDLSQKLILTLSNQAAEAAKGRESLKLEHEQVVREKGDLATKLQEREEQVTDLQNRIKTMTKQIEGMDQDMIKSAEENKNLLLDYEGKLNALHNERRDAQQEIKSLKDSLEEEIRAKSSPILQKQSVSDLQNKVTHLEEELEKTNKEKEELIEKNQELYSEYESKLGELNKNIEDAQSEILNLKESKEELNQKLKSSLAEEASIKGVYENDVQEQQKEIADLRNKLKRITEELDTAETKKDLDLRHLRDSLAQMSLDLENSNQERTEFLQQNQKLYSDYEAKLHELHAEYKDAEKNILRLKRSKESLNQKLDTMTNERVELGRFRDLYQQCIDEKANFEKELKSQATVLLQKERDITDLQNKLKQIVEETEKTSQERKDFVNKNRDLFSVYEKKLAELNDESTSAAKEILRLKGSKEALNEKVVSLLDERAESEIKNNNFQETYEKVIQGKQDLEKEIKFLTANILQKERDMEDLNSKVKQLTEDSEVANREREKLINQNKSLYGEYEWKLQELNNEYEDAEQEILRLKRSKESLNQKLTSMMDERDELESFKDLYQQLMAEKTNLEKEMKSQATNLSQKESDINDLQNKLKKIAEEATNASQEREDFMSSNKKLFSEYEKKLTELEEESTSAAKQMLRLKESKETLNQKLESLLNERAESEIKDKNIQEIYEKAVQEKQNLEQEIKSLTINMLQKERDIESLKSNVKQLTEDFEVAIQEREKFVNQNKNLYGEYERELDELNNEYEDAEKEILRLKKSKEVLNQKVASLLSESAESEIKENDFQGTYEQAMQEKQDLATQIKAMAVDMLQKEKEIEYLKNKVKQMTEEFENTNQERGEFVNLNSKLFCEYEKKLNELNNEYGDAKKEILRLKGSKEAINQKLNSLLNEEAKPKVDVESIKDAYDKVMVEKENLEQEMKSQALRMLQKDNDVGELQEKLGQVMKQLESTNQEMMETVDKNKRLFSEYDTKLDKLNAEHKNAKEEILLLSESNEAINQILTSLVDEAVKSKSYRESSGLSSDESLQEKEDLEKRIASQGDEIRQKEKDIDKLQDKLGQVAKQLESTNQEMLESVGKNKTLFSKYESKLNKLNTEHQNTRKEIVLLRESNEAINQILTSLVDEAVKSKSDHGSFEISVDKYIPGKGDLEKQIASQAGEILQKEKDIDELQEKLGQVAKQLESTNQEMMETVDKNKRLFSEYESKLNKLNAEHKNVRKEIVLLRESKEEINQILTSLIDGAVKSSSDYDSFEISRDKYIQEKRDLEKRIASQADEILQKQKEIKILEKQIALKTDLILDKDREKQNLEKQIASQADEIFQKEKERSILEGQIASQADEILQKQKEIKILEKQIALKTDLILDKDREKQNLEKQIVSQADEIFQKEKERSILEEQIASQADEILQKEKEKGILEEKIAYQANLKLEQDREREKLEKQAESQADEILQKNREKEDLEKQIASLADDKLQKESDKEDLEKQIVLQADMILEKDRENEMLEEQVASQADAILQKDKENDDLQSQLREASEEIENVKQEKTELVKQNKNVFDNYQSKLKDLSKKAEDEIYRLKQDLENALHKQTKQDGDLKNAHKEISNLKDRKEALNQELMRRLKECAAHKRDEENWKRSYEQSIEEKRNLEQQVRSQIDMVLEKQKDIDALQDKLKKMAQQLENSHQETGGFLIQNTHMLSEYERKLGELNTDYKGVLKEVQYIKEDREALSQKLSDCLKELALYKNQQQRLKDVNEQVNREKSDLEKETKSLVATVLQKDEDLKASQRELKRLREDLVNKGQEKVRLVKENIKLTEDYESKLAKIRADYEYARNEIELMKEGKETLNQNLKLAEKTLEQYKEQAKFGQNENSQLGNYNRQLEEKVQELQDELEDSKKKSSSQINKNRSALAGMKQKYELLKREHDQLTEKQLDINLLQKENINLIREMEERDQKIVSLRDETKELENDLGNVRAEMHDYNRKATKSLEELEFVCSELEDKLEQTQRALQQEEIHAATEGCMSELKKEMVELRRSNDVVEEELNKKNEEISRLKQKLQKAEAERDEESARSLKDIEDRETKFLEQIKELENELNAIKDNNRYLHLQFKEYSSELHSTRYNEAGREKSEDWNVCGILKRQLRETKAQNASLEAAMEQHHVKLSAVENRFASLKVENKELQAKLRSLEDERRINRAENEDLSKLKTENKELKTKLLTMEKELAVMGKQLGRVKEQLLTAEIELKDAKAEPERIEKEGNFGILRELSSTDWSGEDLTRLKMINTELQQKVDNLEGQLGDANVKKQTQGDEKRMETEKKFQNLGDVCRKLPDGTLADVSETREADITRNKIVCIERQACSRSDGIDTARQCDSPKPSTCLTLFNNSKYGTADSVSTQSSGYFLTAPKCRKMQHKLASLNKMEREVEEMIDAVRQQNKKLKDCSIARAQNERAVETRLQRVKERRDNLEASFSTFQAELKDVTENCHVVRVCKSARENYPRYRCSQYRKFK